MVLSDRSMREKLEAVRIVIEPLEDGCIQPSSAGLHVDQSFRLL
jgi:dCTP deaminase